MTYILNIETATKNCSVALSRNGQTLLLKEIANEGFSHAERLHVFIEQICVEAAIALTDLSAIAISQGPGSYTGLRIGVSAAKGLCFALDIPLISADTLLLMASKVQIENGFIVPMIDARRMEVYSAVFSTDYKIIRGIEAEILTENSFSDYNAPVYFLGDCTAKAKTVLTKPNFIFLDNLIYPSANEMSKLAYEKFTNKVFEDIAYFEPFYLKDFLITQSKK